MNAFYPQFMTQVKNDEQRPVVGGIERIQFIDEEQFKELFSWDMA